MMLNARLFMVCGQLMHDEILKMALLGEIYYLSNHLISVFGCQFSVYRFFDSSVSNAYSNHLLPSK